MSLELAMCSVSKVLGDGSKIPCTKEEHHSGDHWFPDIELTKSNPRINTKEDPINPQHYKGDTVMVFIEEFDLNFCLGNTVKYIARHAKKDRLQDLRKARWYLDRAISNLELEPINTREKES